jgi:glycosyltransferase involved in cell wall biosynthesis
MSGLITICIPTHRRPSLLLHCVHSCLIQDYRPLEIVISDNSPTEDTTDLVRSITAPAGVTLHYWRNCPAIGAIENHRKVLASASGHRLVWMNDDDVLLPGAVVAMNEGFSRGSDVIAVYGVEQIINGAGEILPERTAYSNAKFHRIPRYAGVRRDMLVCALWRQVPHVGFLVDTEAAKRVGFRDRSEVGLAADLDFAIRLARLYKGCSFVFLDRPTTQTRWAPQGLSGVGLDVCYRLYDVVASLADLSREEFCARDELLAAIAPVALRENALGKRRRAALRIFFSRAYRDHSRESLIKQAYVLCLIAAPGLVGGMRDSLSRACIRRGWLRRSF